MMETKEYIYIYIRKREKKTIDVGKKKKNSTCHLLETSKWWNIW